jgi:hypothetical protein
VRQGREIIRKTGFWGNRFEKRGGAIGFGLRFVVSPAMQEAVMEMAAKKPRQKAILAERAFEAFWRMAK